MKLSRGWRVALVIALTVLLAVPLYQLATRASADYYTQQAKNLYDNVSHYFSHIDNIYNNTLYHDGTQDEVKPQFNFSSSCDGFPDTTGILLLMKTGGTESFDKLPVHLLTTMSCLPDFLIFSDLEQQIGRYHIYDVLDRIDESVKKDHREFELYAAEQRCPVSQKECTADMTGGWDLDKYKFLNMVVRTWEMRPGMDWYVFAESDTYIVWPNMIRWLRERAPVGDSYVGSVAMLNDVPFAHGGSGYVISGSLMKRMVEDIPDLASKYDERATSECCGDFLMSLATQEAGTKVRQAHPMFNGEKPNTLPFGPGQWCEPILTMHHVNSEEISMIWQYEQTRTNKTDIMQIKDIYHAFVAPHLVTLRRDWDNLSDETCYVGPAPEEQQRVGDRERERQKPQDQKNAVEAQAHVSSAACSKVCEAAGLDIDANEYGALPNDVDRGRYIRERYENRIVGDFDLGFRSQRSCFQWRYQNGACCTSNSIKLGTPKREDGDEKRWTSGWFVRGINDWVEARGTCNEIAWKVPY